MSDLSPEIKDPKCLIEAVNVDKSYSTKREVIHVLSQTNLKVLAGEVLGIVGASGVGKSTLLHVLGGLDQPLTGSVLFQGKDIYKQTNSYLDKFRNSHIGFVFQFFNLLPDFTALENAMFPALIKNQDNRSARERAEYLLCEVGMKDRMNHKPGELSGGESQRVALARGLVNQPDLLLADEPTGNLDHHASDDLIELIRKLNQEFNQTFVIVTHSQRVAGKLDRVMELVDGKVSPTKENLII
ncbi:MAG: ABC transporter ATP-binding protein [Nitrospina sp.]|jgi:lipoprotein-releasing system ATP-binding protein|nr:ABC transporter ATP-binding protein [Nitrospina sp.]MBT3511231.1 ABC transporter ATP-binding protein [Nitrospina sp.]MBT3876427.1 ABC transporter ATP-binding protein [Nitrospina sp.]MBT4047545.1 ABC transporter ATP-binding protein [Nitrospina sp.]MBT4558098.1 ABC transporter ATP-binding protein [Nitrospina sp.]